ncbi:MAG TPA: OsmC family protein [Gaiellaceae bacterium]|nr:OsmC family protein [Gaiellaceae bacterium]
MSMSASARMVPGTLRSEVSVRDGRFRLLTDEPEEVGGGDAALMPHELLPAAVAACVATTLAMYARHKGWELGEVATDVDYDAKEHRFGVRIRLGAQLDEEQLARLEKVAASCAVRRSIESDVVFDEQFVV